MATPHFVFDLEYVTSETRSYYKFHIKNSKLYNIINYNVGISIYRATGILTNNKVILYFWILNIVPVSLFQEQRVKKKWCTSIEFESTIVIM